MPSLPTSPCVLERWFSSQADPATRLDYWHDVAHNWVDVQLLTRGDELDASWSLLSSENSFFGTKRCTSYEMRTGPQRDPPGEDMVVISLLEAGEMQLNAAPGEHQRVTAGMLGIYTTQQAAHYRFGHNARQTYIALPRSAALAALGHEPGNQLVTPQHCALAPALVSQLSHLGLLARQSDRADTVEYAGLLDATRALTLLMLRNLGRHQGRSADLPDLTENLHAGRRAAALRFMEQNLHRHDLDPSLIAHGAACSRTRLYEAFAASQTTVMATLRELRLQRAKELIERTPRLHIGALSWRCGFSDASDFGKRFRARFGLPPSEWHRQARAGMSLAGTHADPAASGAGAGAGNGELKPWGRSRA